MKVLTSSSFDYIISLSKESEEYKEVTREQKFIGRFIYDFLNKDDEGVSEEVYYREIIRKGKRIFLFKNMKENEEEREKYLDYLSKYPDSFSEERFNHLKDWFGTYVLMTNITQERSDADSIYSMYKKRWNISPFYKNEDDYNYSEFDREDYFKIQGRCFISLISCLIYKKIEKVIEIASPLTFEDIISELTPIKLLKENGKWSFVNNNDERLISLMQKLHLETEEELNLLK